MKGKLDRRNLISQDGMAKQAGNSCSSDLGTLQYVTWWWAAFALGEGDAVPGD
jgi:hypothetical protein